jgi:hypothetical protein
MAVAAFNFGKAGFMATANMQLRTETMRAAEQAIDELIANTNIELTNPTNLYGTGDNTREFDINGNGTVVTVTVAPPTCVQAVVIKNTELDLTKDDDQGCSRSVDQARSASRAHRSVIRCAPKPSGTSAPRRRWR